MKQKIKNFLLKRRLKVLKNKKGFSLIEIMVVLGLIGIISAIAIPQYQSYQRSARYGVLRSMLAVPYRVYEIEEAQGLGRNNLSGGFLKNRIKSKDLSHFNETYTTGTGNSPNWCFLLDGKSNTVYAGFKGCVDATGSVQIGGANIPCEQFESKAGDTNPATPGVTCGMIASCPTDCQLVGTAHTANTTCTDGQVETKDCEAGSKEVGTKNLNCTAGVCTN